MDKETVEVYEQGTGKLLYTYEVKVAPPPRDLLKEVDALKLEVEALKVGLAQISKPEAGGV